MRRRIGSMSVVLVVVLVVTLFISPLAIAKGQGGGLPALQAQLDATKDRKSLSPMNTVAVLTKVVQKQQEEIEKLKTEKEQLMEKLAALAERQEALEEMFLAVSTNPTKEKLAKYDNAGLDEALEEMFFAVSTDFTKKKLAKYDNAGLDEAQKTIQ